MSEVLEHIRHNEIEKAIKCNTAAIRDLIDWLQTNKGAATKQDLADVYDKVVRTHLPAMEKRIIDAIKASDDPAIVKATTVLKTSTDQLEKVVEENKPISG